MVWFARDWPMLEKNELRVLLGDLLSRDEEEEEFTEAISAPGDDGTPIEALDRDELLPL